MAQTQTMEEKKTVVGMWLGSNIAWSVVAVLSGGVLLRPECASESSFYCLLALSSLTPLICLASTALLAFNAPRLFLHGLNIVAAAACAYDMYLSGAQRSEFTFMAVLVGVPGIVCALINMGCLAAMREISSTVKRS